MTWTTFHRRADVLRSVITTADRRRDGRLPMDVEGVAETFGDELSLLATLQLKWHTRLAGRIENVMATQPQDLGGAVEQAWREIALEMPGVRALLDHYRAEPVDDAMASAMARATQKEHMMLATMAGRSSVGDTSGAPVGAALEERARAGLLAAQHVVRLPDERRTPSLLQRLKAVVAA